MTMVLHLIKVALLLVQIQEMLVKLLLLLGQMIFRASFYDIGLTEKENGRLLLVMIMVEDK